MTSELKTLRVGYASPGWPLKNFPNGIVTYVQNILPGLGSNINPIILAGTLIGDEVEDKLVNLYKFNKDKNLFQKLLFTILYRIQLPLAKSVLYRKMAADNARKIHLAIQALDAPLDILEIEESFGTANSLMKMNKVPIVTRIHGPWIAMSSIMKVEANWDYKYRVFYEGQAIINAHGVTAPSLDVLGKVRQFYGVTLPNARVIPNPVPGVDKDKQWSLSNSKKPTILFVGRFDTLKGGDLVLEAFRQIALKHLDVELLFVGPDRGIQVDGKILMFNDYIERFVPETSIKKRIQFLGHCDSTAIAELRRQSLITVVCSRYEVFSISLTEALAAGCPTVATAVGGMKEIINHGFNGLLAEPESAVSIANNVLDLISNPEKMQNFSKNAIEDCKKRFSPEVVAAQTVDYYREILSSQSRTQINQ
jgi:glycosyltransferase involved in cell wall biosynthesis